jgi:hypothetical protein
MREKVFNLNLESYTALLIGHVIYLKVEHFFTFV